MTDEQRLQQLSRRYEQSRAWFGARHVGFVVPVMAILLLVGASAPWTLAIGIALIAVVAGAGWWRTSMLHGAVLGLGGVLGPALAVTFMNTIGTSLPMASCMQVCLSISLTAGIGLGVVGGLRAPRDAPWPFLAGLVFTGVLAGAGGCAATGVGEALGLAIAVPVAAMPSYAARRLISTDRPPH